MDHPKTHIQNDVLKSYGNLLYDGISIMCFSYGKRFPSRLIWGEDQSLPSSPHRHPANQHISYAEALPRERATIEPLQFRGSLLPADLSPSPPFFFFLMGALSGQAH
jgi:hypothetical protein